MFSYVGKVGVCSFLSALPIKPIFLPQAFQLFTPLYCQARLVSVPLPPSTQRSAGIEVIHLREGKLPRYDTQRHATPRAVGKGHIHQCRSR